LILGSKSWGFARVFARMMVALRPHRGETMILLKKLVACPSFFRIKIFFVLGEFESDA
jgi:hypothetical protein